MTDSAGFDLSSFDRVAQPVGVPPVEATIEHHRRTLSRSGDLRRQLQDLVGSAASDDGRIAAEVNAAGLAKLTLDPRAMRLASEDLAEEIVRVTALAKEDLDARRGELVREFGISATDLDVEQVSAQLNEVVAATRRDGADLEALIERFRSQVGR
jgi:hypothetical protein